MHVDQKWSRSIDHLCAAAGATGGAGEGILAWICSDRAFSYSEIPLDARFYSVWALQSKIIDALGAQQRQKPIKRFELFITQVIE